MMELLFFASHSWDDIWRHLQQSIFTHYLVKDIYLPGGADGAIGEPIASKYDAGGADGAIKDLVASQYDGGGSLSILVSW